MVQQRQNHAFSYVTDQWYHAVWYDTFVWKPGYRVATIYGWECMYVTDDGRWLVLHKYGQNPKIQSVYSLLRNYQQLTLLQLDLTRDGKVDQSDFGVLQAQMGSIGPYSGDLNQDGYVDTADADLFQVSRPK